MRPGVAHAALSAVSMLLACATPFGFVDRSEITPGFSGSFQAGGRGAVEKVVDTEGWAIRPLGLGTACVRYGFSPGFAIFLQGTGGYGQTTTTWAIREVAPTIFDLQTGVKARLRGQSGLRVALGFPSILDVQYLRDFGKSTTMNLGVGVRGLSCGLALRHELAPGISGFLGVSSGMSLGILAPEGVWAMTAMLGIEAARRPSGREQTRGR